MNMTKNRERILKKYNKQFTRDEYLGVLKKTLLVFTLIFAGFQLYTAIFGILPQMQQRSIHLGLVLFIVFLLYPSGLKNSNFKINFFLDIIPAILSLIVNGYLTFFYRNIASRGAMPINIEYLFGIIAFLLVLEAGRRVIGNVLVGLSILSLMYCYFGESFPGIFLHSNISIGRIIQHFYLTPEGIYGVPIGVCSTFLVLFIFFGAFLSKSGTAEFFIDFGNSLAGRSKGGPAKVAVISSALMGTINGSSIANVVTTGTFTIPLMKKTGYKPEFAAGVEAVASTAGQLTPPIMGSAAFIMAEFLGMSYLSIVLAAIFPALLYYFTLFASIDLEARKLNLSPSTGKLHSVKKLLMERGYLFIPVIVILVVLLEKFSPIYAGLYGMTSCIICSYFNKKTRLTPFKIITALEKGVKTVVSVAIPCALIGFIIGTSTVTGLGLVIANNIVLLVKDNLIITLLFAMVACLVLGMGLPTTANYIITSTMIAPVLYRFGVPLLVSHFFCFQFGVAADITPPVCLASYSGAAIANANQTKTGITAVRLGIATFIIPFLFVFSPNLLFINIEFWPLIIKLLTCFCGLFCLVVSLEGYLFKKINIYTRILFFIISIINLFFNNIFFIFRLILFLISLIILYYIKRINPSKKS